MALAPSQRLAAESTARRLLVLAGPGTGKTHTLVARVAHAITRGADPAGIVAISFTNRAAGELARRIESAVGPPARRVRTGTFHALAARSLRQHGVSIGIASDFRILDRRAQNELLAEVCPGPVGPVAEALSTLALGGRPSVAVENFETTLRDYLEKKRSLNALDFDDLLLELHRLLDSPGSEPLRSSIRHLLVDEFQDVSLLEAEISEELGRRGALTVAGDDAQAIYGFRGALPDSLRDFVERSPETEVIALEESHRSTPEILSLAEKTIARNPTLFQRNLRAVRPAAARPLLVEYDDDQDELDFIVARTLEIQRSGTVWEQIAILARTHRQCASIERALVAASIPCSIRGMTQLFDRPEPQRALAWLHLLARPLGEREWANVLAFAAGVGPKTLPTAVAAALGASATPKLEAIVADHYALMGELADVLDQHGPAGTVLALAQKADTSAHEDLLTLAEFFAPFAHLDEALEAVALSNPERVGEGTVTLSTIHQAKGLEWDAVFVAGIDARYFPSPFGETSIEEERRLLYVAMTRARHHLALTGSTAHPSPFLFELDPLLVDRVRLQRASEQRADGNV